MQRFLLFFTLFTIWIYGASFNKTYATVTAINGDKITLSAQMPYSGMSALLVRNTPNGNFALAYLKTNGSSATIIDKDPLDGNPLATLKLTPKIDDQVIGGALYNKVLILAPNTQIESQIKSRYGFETINKELFRSYLATKNSSANATSYKAFAKLVGIGLIVIVKESQIKFYDPISETVIAQESL